MATKIKVTESLDSIAQVPGDLLFRSVDGWERIPGGNAGEVLTSNGQELAPSWEPASGGGGTVTAQRWRVNITANNGGASITLAEMLFYDNSLNIIPTTGGTPSASSNFSGSFDAAKAFDKNYGTRWSTASTATGWLEYQFSAPVLPNIIGFMAGDNASAGPQAPMDFDLQYHDGSDWVDSAVFTGETGWSQQEIRLFQLS